MHRRSSFRLLSALFVLFAIGVSSAFAAPPNRIAGTISGESRIAVPNSVHPRVKAASDQGAAAGDMAIEGMTLRFSLTDAQQASLDQLLADQQNPASPRYHQWLTPAQFGAQFGLSTADVTKVSAWLTGEGFTVTEVATSGTFVRFNGTAGLVERAFNTSVHNLSVNGEKYFANTTDPSLPNGVASVVAGITGLNNFRLKPRVLSRSVVSPRYTSSLTGTHYIAPGDFYTIYNVNPLITGGLNGAGIGTGSKCASTTLNGAATACGDIAVMGQVDLYNTSLTTTPVYSDIAAFRAASGLPAIAPAVYTFGSDPGAPVAQCPPGVYCASEGDLEESSLDVEWASAAAPGATILFVNSTDVINTSLANAIEHNMAPIVTISYGNCESAWGLSDLTTLNQVLMQANAQGITVIAPAGDTGATDCDANVIAATQGLAVDFPGSSPYATAMGGTMLNDGTATGPTTYWNNNSTASTNYAGSALSYIPEVVWNENVAGETFSAGGGGVSNFFAKPTWQQGKGVPADASRDVPDLALNAAASHDGYVYCVSGSCVTGFRDQNSNLTVAGGTSFAAPTFAGILAMVEQKTGARIGNANPVIYALANSTTYYQPGATIATNNTVVFNDVTSGNNSSPCQGGTPNCASGGSIGFSAGQGYDLATGWGSVNAYNLANAWSLVKPLGASIPPPPNCNPTCPASAITTLTASAASVVGGATPANAVTLTAAVSGTTSTPTGSVQFLQNNTAMGSPVPLTNGVATYSYAASCSSLGPQIFQASYLGDGTYTGTKGAGITLGGFSSNVQTVTPVTVNVTAGSCADFNLTVPNPTINVASGGGIPSAVLTVTPMNGFTGTVTFNAATTNYTSTTVPTPSFSPGSVTISGTTAATTTISLSNITASLHQPALPRPSRMPWYGAGSGAAVASLVCLLLPRRRRLGSLLLAAFAAALVFGAAGCGGTKNGTIPGGGGSGGGNTDAGSYLVTVTATYTNSSNQVVTSHSQNLTFNVQ